jgi:hypothetical protein
MANGNDLLLKRESILFKKLTRQGRKKLQDTILDEEGNDPDTLKEKKDVPFRRAPNGGLLG